MELNGSNIVNGNKKFFPLTKDNGLHYLKAGTKGRFIKLNKSDIKDTLKAKATKGKDELKKSCDDFEAIMLNFLLAEMRKTVNKTDLFGEGNFSNETFTSMLDSEIAKNVAGNGSLGISESMYNQLTNTMPGSVSGTGLRK